MTRPLTVTARQDTPLGVARAGTLRLASGDLPTPALLPDLPQATGRGLSPWDLDAAPIRALKVDPLELMERPGAPLIHQHGGLRGFLHFPQPLLSQSGGQSASLSRGAKLGTDGVTHRRPIDGRRVTLSPRGALAFQRTLGADIATALSAAAPDKADAAAHRAAALWTRRWLAESLDAQRPEGPLLFAAVTGGPDAALRVESAQSLADAPVDGFSLAAFSPRAAAGAVRDAVAAALAVLPREPVRHVVDAHGPLAVLDAIAAGADLVDCSFATRHARNGNLYGSQERLSISQSRYRGDMYPPDTTCGCPVCAKHTRAYLNHLFRIKETLGATLASLHNLWWLGALVDEARAAIEDGTFAAVHERVRSAYG